VIDKDGWAQPAPWKCDTLNVAPGERWDVIVNCNNPGTWAFHCHILPHAEGPSGMFGMVTALVVNEPASAAVQLASAVLPGAFPRTAGGPIRSAARAGGSAAFTCRIPA